MASKGSVYRRGSTWTAHLSWKTGTRQHQAKRGGFRTKKAASDALVDLAAAVQGGRYVPVGKRTVAEYLTGWLAGLRTAGRRETTIAGYRRLVENHIVPQLGDILLVELSALDVDRLYGTMTAKGLKAATVRRAHSVLHKALGDACRKGVLASNVAAMASPPKSSAARAPEASTWTPEQLRVFLERVRRHHHGTFFRLAALSGLRRGELCGLRWSDVDLERASLAVRQTITTVDNRPVLGDVKTPSSRRVIDLDAGTVAVLRRHRVAQKEWRMMAGPGWTDTGLVFCSPDGKGWNPDTISQAFDRQVAASGLPRITLHGLRHSHCTHLLASGHDARLVSARLGHASVAFTLDRYGHVMPGHQASAAAAVAALVDGAP